MRREEARTAYQSLGREATLYDGMITCSTPPGKLICGLAWKMDKPRDDHYLDLALSSIPENFSGRMPEIPVGAGILTVPVYRTLPKADIACLDYSTAMMETTQRRTATAELFNVHFTQGGIGSLPFSDNTFDLVLSLNGFHAFPSRKATYRETFRVLEPGGIFCGCFCIRGEQSRTN